MKYKIEEIINFFRQHPNYPFNNYYVDYDEYCAARLMILSIVKAYIPKNEINNWNFLSDYYDARRNDPEAFYSLLSCINKNKEQVLFFAIVDNREDYSDYNDITINVERDDSYGDKWRDNSPMEDWYSVFQITLNLKKLMEYKKIDEVLNLYFTKNLNFDELYMLQE